MFFFFSPHVLLVDWYHQPLALALAARRFVILYKEREGNGMVWNGMRNGWNQSNGDIEFILIPNLPELSANP